MAGSPINDITQMRNQGLTNNQIIQNLQRQGYSNTQIFDAMNQVDTKMAVEGMQQAPNQQASDNQPQSGLFTSPGQDAGSPPPATNQVRNIFSNDQTKIEELVETIIEEKWVELVNDVSKIVEWKNRVESKVVEMEVQLKTLNDKFSDLNQAVLGKINEYDKHIMEIGSDIKAMEKVFSKVLPVFTENVNELSRISKTFKEVKPHEKSTAGR